MSGCHILKQLRIPKNRTPAAVRASRQLRWPLSQYCATRLGRVSVSTRPHDRSAGFRTAQTGLRAGVYSPYERARVYLRKKPRLERMLLHARLGDPSVFIAAFFKM